MSINTWLSDEEIASGISARLQAQERGGEGVISYAVLGLINRDGDVTVGEFFDNFLPAKAAAGKKETKAAAEAKRIRNRHSKYFAAAKAIYNAHGEYIQKQLMKLPADRQTTEGAVSLVDSYLWETVNPSARYRNEHHAVTHLAKAKAYKSADEKLDSYVKAVVKRLSTEMLTPDNARAIRQALKASEQRTADYMAEEEARMIAAELAAQAADAAEEEEEQRLAA